MASMLGISSVEFYCIKKIYYDVVPYYIAVYIYIIEDDPQTKLHPYDSSVVFSMNIYNRNFYHPT